MNNDTVTALANTITDLSLELLKMKQERDGNFTHKIADLERWDGNCTMYKDWMAHIDVWIKCNIWKLDLLRKKLKEVTVLL